STYNRHSSPIRLSLEHLVNTTVSVQIRSKVSGNQIIVMGRFQRVDNINKVLSWTEHSSINGIQSILKIRVLNISLGSVSVSAILNLVGCETKHKHIFLTNGLSNFNIGTIMSTNN